MRLENESSESVEPAIAMRLENEYSDCSLSDWDWDSRKDWLSMAAEEKMKCGTVLVIEFEL